MTTTRSLALASACLAALTLAACGGRGHKSADAEPESAMSETVSDLAASEAPAAVVPASPASVRVPGPAAARPHVAEADLNDDEVAAAGDTRRRPPPAPSDTPQ